MYGGLIPLRIRGPLVLQHESVVFLQFRCGNYAIFPIKCGIFAICRFHRQHPPRGYHHFTFPIHRNANNLTSILCLSPFSDPRGS